MFTQKMIQDIEAVAEIFDIDSSYLFAICLVETAGKVFVRIREKDEPIIRFEGHYFDRRLKGKERTKAREQNLSSPYAGKIRNPKQQEERWNLLHRAASIDWNAAMESASWGIGQVMGANWPILGFKSVEDFVTQARSGCDGQAALTAHYLHKKQLIKHLKNQNWEKFAYKYNGAYYKKNHYHIKLKKAYTYCLTLPKTTQRILKNGIKSDSVRYLQWLLRNTGKKINLDGIFGKKTEEAVASFQKESHLPISGIAESKTLGHLRAYKGKANKIFYAEKNIPLWLKYLHYNIPNV